MLIEQGPHMTKKKKSRKMIKSKQTNKTKKTKAIAINCGKGPELLSRVVLIQLDILN